MYRWETCIKDGEKEVVKNFLKKSEFLKFGVLFRVKIENSPGKMQNLPIFWG